MDKASRSVPSYESSPRRVWHDAADETAGEPMRQRKSSISELHAQISVALRLGRVDEALDLYERIEKAKPDEPRWSHRKGELLHRIGRDRDAAVAYQRAVDLYAAKGFEARAQATEKLMDQLRPL